MAEMREESRIVIADSPLAQSQAASLCDAASP